MISNILVPTDGSETALKAIEYATELAKQLNATIILLGVIDIRFLMAQSMNSADSPTHLIESMEDYVKQAVEVHLEEAEILCKKRGVQVKKTIKSGHPVEEIIAAAKEAKCDLMVIGSHGKSAIKAAVLGSVTFGVIHNDSKIPILVVKK